MKYTTPILAIAVLAVVCRADEVTLPDLRKLYESRAAQIEAALSNATATALQEYGTTIEAAKDRYRTQGDLDGLLGVNKEIERFAKEGSCPDTDPRGLPPLVKDARTVYRSAYAAAVQTKTADFIRLAKAYVSRLKGLEQQHVRQESIEAAIDVRDEVKRIEFILADLQSRQSEARAPKQPEGLFPKSNVKEAEPLSLAGVWKRDKSNFIFTFRPDGTWVSENANAEGRWQLQGDKVSFHWPGAEFPDRSFTMDGPDKFFGENKLLGRVVYTRVKQ